MTDERRKRGHRRLTAQEEALWRAATRAVSPLRTVRPAEPAGERAELRATDVGAPAAPPERSKPPAASSRPSAPPLAPIDRRLKQRLSRGTEAISARIDLHGLTQNEAHRALIRFLRRAQGEGARTVLVITGKGIARADDHVSSPGVLRRQVPLWLRLPDLRELVLGFEPAGPAHGGEGALYVRLRRGKKLTE